MYVLTIIDKDNKIIQKNIDTYMKGIRMLSQKFTNCDLDIVYYTDTAVVSIMDEYGEISGVAVLNKT